MLRRRDWDPVFFFMSIKTKTRNRGVRNVVSFPQSMSTYIFIPLHTFFSYTHTFFSHTHTLLVQYTGKKVQVTFDSVDCIRAPAFVFPNKIIDDYYYVQGGGARSEVVFTVVPIHFLHRDDWPSMDTAELTIQKSEYDLERDDEKKESMLRKLMVD